MTQTRARGFGFFFILTLAISVTAFGANPNPINDTAEAVVGNASVSASAIQWSASGSYERLVLTVSGPESFSLTREFEAGRVPTLRLVDLGKDLTDGSYSWQVRIVPRISPDTRRKLALAREAGDEQAAGRIQAEAGLNRDFTHSGSFMIQAGAFVGNSGEEPAGPGSRKVVANALKPKPEDQVYPDDVIIQGSACVGLDCVNNESFGFDTIRLKENNTRINFTDTSVGTFPTNDWELTANDSASGAASKFSITDITGSKVPFTVTAGALTNSIFVDSSGRVGFRTSTPVLDLHVNTANTPALRLEQNNSGGFTAQTWDIGANEANFFVRDVTGGSKLSLRIRPGAPTSSLDISSDGDIGIGTGSPAELLHVFANEDANTLSLVNNPNATGLSAAAVTQSKADVAVTSLIAHGSGRTAVRFGQVLGGFSELLNAAGDGLMVGTIGATPLILGTNATARMTIDSAGAVTVPGNFTVSGVKNFAAVDPADSKKALYYTALEGPEAGTYFRGTAKTVNGEVVIELPGYFARLTESERMTVQLTPIGAPGQLYVAKKSPEQLVIKVADGTADLEFDYLVQGIRKGYLNYEVERVGAFPVQQ